MQSTPTAADVDAARLLLARQGVSPADLLTSYVRADLPEVATALTALTALTGETHPLAASDAAERRYGRHR